MEALRLPDWFEDSDLGRRLKEEQLNETVSKRRVAVEEIQRLETTSSGEQPVTASITIPAGTPGAPITPNTRLNLALGFLLSCTRPDDHGCAVQVVLGDLHRAGRTPADHATVRLDLPLRLDIPGIPRTVPGLLRGEL